MRAAAFPFVCKSRIFVPYYTQHVHRMMMNRLLPIFFAFLPVVAQAQLFAPPQPMMYRQACELEAPPAHARRIVVSRYIPGARFPNSWDIQVEERSYDPQGRLINWKRFDAYSGVRMYEKTVTWNAQGDRLEERTWRAELSGEEVLKYSNEYGPNGKLTSTLITDDRAKPLGTITVNPDGSRNTVIGTIPGKRIIFVHSPAGFMMSSTDESTKQEDRYTYDDSGQLAGIERIRNGVSSKVTYKNTYDPDGHLIVQEEQLDKGVRKMLFEYNDKGQLRARKWDPVRPSEVYGYGAYGQLSDVMQYSQEGYPKETQSYWTEYYR